MTGTTTMRIDEGLDTGPILLDREMAIEPDQTAEDLSPALAESGAELMLETLARLDPAGPNPIQPRAQDDRLATAAPILKREDALVDFARSAHEIYNRWRGFQPWPGAYTLFRGRKLILRHLKPADELAVAEEPGRIDAIGNRILVSAGGKSRIELLELQWEGRRNMGAAEFFRGARIANGDRLGE